MFELVPGAALPKDDIRGDHIHIYIFKLKCQLTNLAVQPGLYFMLCARKVLCMHFLFQKQNLQLHDTRFTVQEY